MLSIKRTSIFVSAVFATAVVAIGGMNVVREYGVYRTTESAAQAI